ncbi:YdhK family protein [Eupransor demetentiae]|uniref:LysM repeat (LysM) n=1 Tax=Eupransor demetentiae TaxID=3109584 RepID=A0ABP0EMY4_9LACO|nr:LysM repeat (LysM) [Lactobacillaceae bacterium LMG 33000]
MKMSNDMNMSNDKDMKMGGMDMSSDKNMSGMDMNMGGMKMNIHGTLPSGLPDAQNSKYKVGQEIISQATHMPGMKGAKAKIVAVYDATLYAVDFKSTDGMEMKDHKWLTRVDFTDGKDHKVGDDITIASAHMSGMKGAQGKVVEVKAGPAYAINYQPTDGSEEVTNHLYLAEDEIQPR